MFHYIRSLAAIILAWAVLFAPRLLLAQDTPTGGFETGKRADPIALAAYGKLFDSAGKEIKPSPKFVRHVLSYYEQRLLSEADEKIRKSFADRKSIMANEFKADDLAAHFLAVEWLIESVSPPDRAYLYAKNRTLRMVWYKDVLGENRFWEVMDKVSGLPRDIADVANKNGMLRKATTATGADYIRECRDAGVPIPPTWGDEGPGKWNFVSDLNPNFLQSGNPAKIYRYDSQSPEGLCVALPRINGNTIGALGVICLGRKSANACFFDNANVQVGARVPMDQFLSGGNLGDVCSDCHAGENPFIVHPASGLNMAPANKPDQWYTPLVRPDWPHNPGPSGLLAQVPINTLPPAKDASCLECHTQTSAGRFPDVLELNRIAGGMSGYCRRVVSNAIGTTMPAGPPYQKHVNAMRAFCRQSSPPGSVVDKPQVKDNPKVISPPLVIGPLYACAEAVEVRGGVLDAKLVVRVNGSDRASVKVNRPSSMIVQIGALVTGDVVEAFQDANGIVSDPSPTVTVEDHTVAYPSGLPPPTIDPTLIHECGRTIAVRHVRGAEVTVLTNGGDPAIYGTGGDWTNLPPAIRPFKLKDEYSARQRLCRDTSTDSATQSAVAPPSPMPVPTMDPPVPVAGQRLVNLTNLANGALTSVSGSGSLLAEFSTAVNRQPEVDVATRLGRPLQPGDRLGVQSLLCTGTKVDIPETTECRSLPAPAIQRPLVGDRSVTVTVSIPGARIKVFDNSGIKIGEGSGILVGLTRAIANRDVLTVTQNVEQCEGGAAYRIEAVCATLECK